MAGMTVRRSDGETLNVLGMPLHFLCDAHQTDGAWSLMEEDIPICPGTQFMRSKGGQMSLREC